MCTLDQGHRQRAQGQDGEQLAAQVRAELDLCARAEGAVLQWIDKPTRRWWLRIATNDAMTAGRHMTPPNEAGQYGSFRTAATEAGCSRTCRFATTH